MILPLLLFVHLLAVALIFLATGIEVAAFIFVRRATTVEQTRAALTPTPMVGPIIGPSAGVLILAGVGMVFAGGFGWQPWIVTGLLVAVALSVNGPLTNGRRMERLYELARAAPSGSITPDLEAARSDRFLTYSVGVLFTLMACMLYVMSNKPPAPVCLAAVAIALIVAAVPILAKR
ncbi:MAG: hypothetical protein JWM87_1557 [Candidatus Eremiobacteraeota bacterium]|nr:hypothetical protein [Candidatus Eremiobacteraeota bacterium]